MELAYMELAYTGQGFCDPALSVTDVCVTLPCPHSAYRAVFNLHC